MSSLLNKPIIIEMSGRGPQGVPGELYFPTFHLDYETGHLIVDGYIGHYNPEFHINNNNGHLEVVLP